MYALLELLDLLPYLILSIVTGYTVLCLECPVPSTSAEELVPKDEELPVASASILELKHLKFHRKERETHHQSNIP